MINTKGFNRAGNGQVTMNAVTSTEQEEVTRFWHIRCDRWSDTFLSPLVGYFSYSASLSVPDTSFWLCSAMQ